MKDIRSSKPTIGKQRALAEAILENEIKEAFSLRLIPLQVIKFDAPRTPEQEEALWFSGRDWRDITKEDWMRYSDAFCAFTSEAFKYYLPSVLLVALHDSDDLLVVDSLLNTLDRSPTIEYWDDFLIDRMLGLKLTEYDALQSWVLSLSGKNSKWDEDSLTRCFETVELLKQETVRLQA